jgi:DnaJ family protein A protein 2
MRGRLYIKFNVEFPESGFLSPSQSLELEKILPQKTSKKLSQKELDDCEDTTLHDVDLAEEMSRKKQQYREAYDDDDDEDEHSMPRVQCAQQ